VWCLRDAYGRFRVDYVEIQDGRRKRQPVCMREREKRERERKKRERERGRQTEREIHTEQRAGLDGKKYTLEHIHIKSSSHPLYRYSLDLSLPFTYIHTHTHILHTYIYAHTYIHTQISVNFRVASP